MVECTAIADGSRSTGRRESTTYIVPSMIGRRRVVGRCL